jgi:hypothetical protein
MKAKLSVCVFLSGIVPLLLTSAVVFAGEAPKQPIVIKLEGAKTAPVTYSHATHQKIACAKCHHKDAKSPKACTTCHTVKGVQGGALAAKEAFHAQCQGCHKGTTAKGVSPPTKCDGCHKK